MSEQTHTPGPWTARKRRTGDEWWVEAPNRNGAVTYLAECCARQDANAANARLIAAAPELLAALIGLMDGEGDVHDKVLAARAAIQSATAS